MHFNAMELIGKRPTPKEGIAKTGVVPGRGRTKAFAASAGDTKSPYAILRVHGSNDKDRSRRVL